MDVSIIICSYNRCQNLQTVLRSLQRLCCVGLDWEAVIVDNNSTDETRSVVKGLMAGGFRNLRYVFERRQGKSFALNTGIKESKGNLLAFTDDDCIVDSNWLLAIAKEFQTDPELIGLGGRVEPWDKSAARVAQRTYRTRMTLVRPEQVLSMIIGCNMAFRKQVFDTVGGFDKSFGPGGRMGAVAEDLDFLYRAYKLKSKLLYSPEIVIYHNHRRSDAITVEATKRTYTIGRGALYCKHMLLGDKDMFKFAYWEVSSLLKQLLVGMIRMESTLETRKVLGGLLLGVRRQILRGVRCSAW